MRCLPSSLPFYKMLFMNKLEFSSFIDCFVGISETIEVVWFSVRFSSLRCNQTLNHFQCLLVEIVSPRKP